jgi:hypothetical protein
VERHLWRQPPNSRRRARTGPRPPGAWPPIANSAGHSIALNSLEWRGIAATMRGRSGLISEGAGGLLSERQVVILDTIQPLNWVEIRGCGKRQDLSPGRIGPRLSAKSRHPDLLRAVTQIANCIEVGELGVGELVSCCGGRACLRARWERHDEQHAFALGTTDIEQVSVDAFVVARAPGPSARRARHHGVAVIVPEVHILGNLPLGPPFLRITHPVDRVRARCSSAKDVVLLLGVRDSRVVVQLASSLSKVPHPLNGALVVQPVVID